MSKRCIRPLVALSSRLPAPGAGAENAAIRTGDRMVPPAAHSESRLRAAVLRFAPAEGRYAPSRLTTGVCPLPLGQGGATGSASPASGLPFCASAAAFRGSDCIRRSALRRITASGHDPPEYARIRFPERRSEKRHPLRPRRRAICTVSVDDRRLPASARTGGATGSASPASGLPFCASAAAFRGSEPDSAFFPTVRRLDRRRPAGGRIMNNKKSTFKQLF